MTTDDPKGLALFEQQMIRRVWHNNEWYYSIVDVIAVLTESANPRNYWTTLKTRAKRSSKLRSGPTQQTGKAGAEAQGDETQLKLYDDTDSEETTLNKERS
jgi:hypothetical protein